MGAVRKLHIITWIYISGGQADQFEDYFFTETDVHV